MMKRISVLSLAFAGLFLCPVYAQNSGSVPLNSVPIGKGPGVQGFGSAAPVAGYALIGNVSGPPSFQAFGAASLGPQTANSILAGPTSGASANPTFRALVGADLPLPAASTLGGMFSSTAVTNQFLTGIATSGAVTRAQPAFSNLSGSWACSQAPALTGNVTSTAGTCTTTIPASTVTNAMLAGSIAASKLVGSDIATVGTITSGVWTGTAIAVANGGTGSTTAANARTALGLGNVDNTSDANKPVSTAQAAADALKADINNPTFTTQIKSPVFRANSNLGGLSIPRSTGGVDINVLTMATDETELRGSSGITFKDTTVTALGRFAAGGGFVSGSTATDQGVGTVNAQGGFFVNNTSINSVAATYTNKTINGSSNTLSNTFTLTTTGSSGAATYNGTTLNIPTYAGGGAGTPGGSTTQVQYNNAGAFGGITGATTNGTALTLVAPVLGTPASATLTNATGLPISTGLTGAGTGVLTALGVNVGTAGSPVVNGGALGTPSAGVATNLTGTAAGLTAGTVTTNANLTGAITSSGNTTSLGSFTSANLSGALSDETGTGANVFANGPTLVAPILGTPASGTLTNATGYPTANLAGAGTGVLTALGVNVGSAGSVVVNGGALGTPSSGTLTNATGLPLAGVSTALTTLIKGNGTVLTTATAGVDYQAPISLTTTGTSGPASFSAGTLNIPQYSAGGGGDTSSAVATSVTGQLAVYSGTTGKLITTSSASGVPVLTSGVVSTATTTGSNNVVFSTSPTLVTPILGTPTSVTLTNATGLPLGGVSTASTSLIKGNGTTLAAATAGTDYSAGTSALATGILKSTTSTGALTIAVAGDFPTLNQNTSGSAASLSATLAVGSGGTGLASYTAGDMLYASGVNTIAKLAAVASGNVLLSGTSPSWGKVDLTTYVSGTLPVANGGTGVTSSTGSGSNVLNTSPSLVTPTLGVASATSVNKVAITAPATSATLTIADGTTLTQTTSTSVGRGQYLGTATNDNATAGNIGEFVSAVLAQGSATALTTGSSKTVTSISLTAGDWDVSGVIGFSGGTTTTITDLYGNINTTTNALGANSYEYAMMKFSNTTPLSTGYNFVSFVVPSQRLSLASTTTVYLIGNAAFGVSTLSGYGKIEARRIR